MIEIFDKQSMGYIYMQYVLKSQEAGEVSVVA